MRKLYADVIVNISREELDRTFTYLVPENLEKSIRIGSSVLVPFGGGGRTISGYVVKLDAESTYQGEGIKEIFAVNTDDETTEAGLVELAAWMCHTYGSTMNKALRTVLPMRKKAAGRVERMLSLLSDEDTAKAYLQECLDKNRTAKARVMAYLLDHGASKWEDVIKGAHTSAAVLRGLQAEGRIQIVSSSTYRHVVKDAGLLPSDVLTDEQTEAVRDIQEEWTSGNRPVLLYGITGSGKTLVYMEMIEKVIREGRQAIVLIPEISLTYQTVLRFVHRFGDGVSFLHSRLSEAERYDQFKAAKKGDVRIMVGPRSALFTPFPNLGLIVIDEEHEQSYHSEIVPRYHARETAVHRAMQCDAHVLMGSATPSLEAYDRCMKGEYGLVKLTRRYGRSLLPEVRIADMRQEIHEGNRSILSRDLYREIADRLNKKQQVMLFLNRRGFAGFVTCRRCGYVVKCPHCDVSLTQHADGTLVCHYCGYTEPMIKECPNCHSDLIGGIKTGTEQVEAIVKKEFPRARLLRMDMDTTRGKEGHEKILKEFGAGNADILIGTQMIVKGHDFPDVTLVGVLMADLSLNDSDFRSSERTFSLITQAVGRCGRGDHKGLAIVQTYQPDHYSIRCAARQDYEEFYKEEMAYRRLLRYPPAGAMAAILGSSENEKKLTTAMVYIKKYIRRIDPKDQLHTIGPAPQTISRLKDHYRMIIYIRNMDADSLIRAKDMIERYIRINKGFDDINIQFDFNV